LRSAEKAAPQLQVSLIGIYFSARTAQVLIPKAR